MREISLKKLNNVTKILLILLIGVILYFAVFSILKPFFIKEPTSMMDMMRQMTGSNSFTAINLVSLIIAITVVLIISFYLFSQDSKEREYNVMRRALSGDEKKILDEVKKAGEITQDSLRFRLDWSKAKVSTILTNLDKRGLIQRERIGKTYKVCLEKS